VSAGGRNAAVMLKSLFCWRGHCDTVSGLIPRYPAVEILVLLEGALRPARGRRGVGRCHVEILVLLEGALRLKPLIDQYPMPPLKSLFCWRGHCDCVGRIYSGLWRLKSLFCWRGHCDATSGVSALFFGG